ncbi:L,D-transpeptidase ErfK/SrfK/L,D-transpeptidase YbiS [Colwellia chukchiensis]|uniref:L,D-transpeptidase ErfK/SrfK/L,D-transpeptidase YbiS n=1 Tax=Colwellia chukchiensis TaxID=641665 RepID=A0A1H7J2C4_9GAMM|nr:L,D-transpeptidase family protein [Colwellia chukchiensis]SEK68584.1 L,D-transpeptidase ErfK/SrfK/L,D-transpeptidase YbiS [Colwellia chukchiensis]
MILNLVPCIVSLVMSYSDCCSIIRRVRFVNLLTVIVLLLLLLRAEHVLAKAYPLPAPGSRLIGELQTHQIVKGDYFQAIAEQYNVGFLALMAANPGVDPFLPEPGTSLLIPSQMLLPYTKREGIVINLPELRLYYFPKNGTQVHVFPVGIGRQGLATPKTVSYISEKRKDPVWRPTAETKARYFKEHGKQLADEIPAGANNPFGKYALRLGRSVYLLHGSNQRFGIGMRSSSGCIRLYDDDIEWLYKNVDINTPVRIVEQPIKLSYEAAHRLMEVHSPLTGEEGEPTRLKPTPAVRDFVGNLAANKALLSQQIASPTGLVITLSTN